MRKSIIVGSWKRFGLERLIHRRGDGLFLVPLDHPVAPGVLASCDGLTRMVDRVRSCLASRHVRLPDDTSDDPVHAETVHGLGNRKNELVLAKIDHLGVEAYRGSARYLDTAQPAGLPPAAVSASASCCDVLVAAGIEYLVEDGVDGKGAAERHLCGTPAPDIGVAAAQELGVTADWAAGSSSPWSGWHRAGPAISDGWSASRVAGRAVRSSGAELAAVQ